MEISSQLVGSDRAIPFPLVSFSFVLKVFLPSYMKLHGISAWLALE